MSSEELLRFKLPISYIILYNLIYNNNITCLQSSNFLMIISSFKFVINHLVFRLKIVIYSNNTKYFNKLCINRDMMLSLSTDNLNLCPVDSARKSQIH